MNDLNCLECTALRGIEKNRASNASFTAESSSMGESLGSDRKCRKMQMVI